MWSRIEEGEVSLERNNMRRGIKKMARNKQVNKTNFISVRELRLEMPRYINEVAQGKTFIVIKRSKPVFKITPVVGKFE